MQRTTASWSDAAGDRAYIEWSSAADNRFGTYLHVYFCARVCRASGQPLDSYIFIYKEREREIGQALRNIDLGRGQPRKRQPISTGNRLSRHMGGESGSGQPLPAM